MESGFCYFTSTTLKENLFYFCNFDGFLKNISIVEIQTLVGWLIGWYTQDSLIKGFCSGQLFNARHFSKSYSRVVQICMKKVW